MSPTMTSRYTMHNRYGSWMHTVEDREGFMKEPAAVARMLGTNIGQQEMAENLIERVQREMRALGIPTPEELLRQREEEAAAARKPCTQVRHGRPGLKFSSTLADQVKSATISNRNTKPNTTEGANPMAAVKIRAGRGAATVEADKPAKRPAKRTAKPKPAARRPTAKAGAKPAKRRSVGRPRKAEGEPVRRNSTGVDPKVEARLLKAVKAAGDRRRAAKIEHEESVNALYEVAQEALDAGVSMAKVSDASDLSRQWLYKMGEHAGRENGGSAPAPAKRTAKAKPKPASTGTRRTRTTTRSVSKPRARTRVSIRS